MSYLKELSIFVNSIFTKTQKMFRLSKKVEYGILSLQYLADREGTLVPAKEIAAHLDLSFEFLAKTMQTLMKKGLIASQQGIKGGYYLTKKSSDISLSDIVYALDSTPKLVECIEDHANKDACLREGVCTIKRPLSIIQKKVDELFLQTTLENLKSKNQIPNNLVELKIDQYSPKV